MSVPPESIDWVMELLMGERRVRKAGTETGSQHVGEEFRHLMLFPKITTLVIPVPVGWLHLQFWFLLWSLLLD